MHTHTTVVPFVLCADLTAYVRCGLIPHHQPEHHVCNLCLPGCYSGVTVLLLCCHSITNQNITSATYVYRVVTVVSLCCCYVVIASPTRTSRLPHLCYRVVTVLSQCCHGVVTVLLLCCHSITYRTSRLQVVQ
jgi:hypothetical protein